MTQHFDPTKLVLVEAPGSTRPEMPEHYDRAKIDELLAAGGILFGNERRLVHQVVWHGKPVGDVVTLEITSEALAEIMSSSTRAIRKWRKVVEQVPGITVESSRTGYRWCINLTVLLPGTTTARRRHDGGTTAEPSRNDGGTEDVGTIGATCGQASPEQELPTEVLAVVAEREQAREDEAAATSSPEFDLGEFIQGELKAAGLKPLAAYTLDKVVGNTKVAMPDERTQREFVEDKIGVVANEGYSSRTVINMLSNDHDGWLKARADREAIYGSIAAPVTPKQKPTAKPSNAFTSPGFDERLEEAIKRGTRNTKNTPKVDYAAQNREREARNVHEWLIKQGTIPADQPFSLEWLEQAGWME